MYSQLPLPNSNSTACKRRCPMNEMKETSDWATQRTLTANKWRMRVYVRLSPHCYQKKNKRTHWFSMCGTSMSWQDTVSQQGAAHLQLNCGQKWLSEGSTHNLSPSLKHQATIDPIIVFRTRRHKTWFCCLSDSGSPALQSYSSPGSRAANWTVIVEAPKSRSFFSYCATTFLEHKNTLWQEVEYLQSPIPDLHLFIVGKLSYEKNLS